MVGTMTGRNFGWLPSQYSEAIAHIADVIRKDNGSSQIAADRLNGLSYSVLFKGTDSRITKDLLLPPSQRLDVSTATDTSDSERSGPVHGNLHEGPSLSA